MNKIILALFALIGFSVAACARQKQDTTMTPADKKILVVYFSATGTTAKAAQKLSQTVHGSLYAITPKKTYTDKDLDWTSKSSRSSQEMNNPQARPAIKESLVNIADYNVVFIGYPIWWDLAPRIINTFIESHDLKGKIIIPFATSGGSSISNSVSALRKSYPELNWKKGMLLNRTDENTLKECISLTE